MTSLAVIEEDGSASNGDGEVLMSCCCRAQLRDLVGAAVPCRSLAMVGTLATLGSGEIRSNVLVGDEVERGMGSLCDFWWEHYSNMLLLQHKNVALGMGESHYDFERGGCCWRNS